jgi:glucose/mannose-6-phosphate isomerase
LERLDNERYIADLDKGKMRSLIAGLPEQFVKAADVFKQAGIDLKGNYRSVVVSGMGGSAIGGDLVSAFLAPTLQVPMTVVRNYEVPSFVSRDTLFIAVSYSGNTEETLSSFQDARRKGSQVVCIGSGGVLIDLAKSESLPFLAIPGNMPPRCAIGYLVVPMLLCIASAFDIPGVWAAIEEAGDVLKKMRPGLEPSVHAKENAAKKMAGNLVHKLPVVYSTCPATDPVARRWSTQINENAKTLCHHNSLPELDHNEIVGWGIPREVSYGSSVVFLDPGNLPERLKKRLKVTKDVVSQVAQTEVAAASGSGNLARLVSLVYLGDYTSFYLAMLNGVDPTPIERIDFLKRRLREED